jgi:hypothetical protein
VRGNGQPVALLAAFPLTVIGVPACTVMPVYHGKISLYKYPGERERQSLSLGARQNGSVEIAGLFWQPVGHG